MQSLTNMRYSGVQSATCPLCASRSFVRLRFGLLSCTNCCLVVSPKLFSTGFAKQANLDAFGDSYEPESSFWVRMFHQWKARRYLAYLSKIHILKGNLLEIGVGSGSFLDAARRAGFTVTGCDLSPEVCEYVRSRYGIPVLRDDLNNLPKARWEVVVMSHVLEHVDDPLGFLQAARERLKPGGVLFVAVPNVSCTEALLPGWNYYLAVHLLYFSPHTLSRALERTGFHVLRLRTHENFSTWFLTGLRTFLGLQSHEGPSPYAASLGRVPRWWRYAEHPYRMAMIAAGALSWPIRNLQGRFGRGDEIIALARSA